MTNLSCVLFLLKSYIEHGKQMKRWQRVIVFVVVAELFIDKANVMRPDPERSPIIKEFRKQKLNPNSLPRR